MSNSVGHPASSVGMLHSQLHADSDADAIVHNGKRLDHAEGASKPLKSRPDAATPA